MQTNHPSIVVYDENTSTVVDQPDAEISGPQVGNFENVKPVVLMEASSLFPFDFFPSRIRVSTHSVAVIDQFFIASHETTTILIEDIFNIDLITVPFFCSLHLTNRQPMMPIVEIKFLRKDDGEKLKNLIQGLMMMKAKKVDLAKYSREEICEQLEHLGAVATT